MAVGPAAPKRVAVPAPAPVPKAQPRRPSARKAGAGVQSGATAAVGGGPAAGLPSKLPPGPAGADPRFRQALDRLDRSAARSRQHPPAGKKVVEAEAASQLPKEVQQQAGARQHHVEAMRAAPVGEKPQESTFLEDLRKAIKATMPDTVEQGDSYMKGSDRQNLTNTITGNIQQQKAQSAGPVNAERQAPLKPDNVQTEPTASVPPAPTPPAALPVGAAQAMPLARPAAEVSLEPAKRDTNRLLTDNELTPDQLKNANDPRFSAVLTTKAEADAYADSGPVQYRGREQTILATAATQASTEEKQALGAFHGSQVRSGNAVFARQLTAREKDEVERKAVVDHIQGIYARTKKAVDETLDGMERDATRLFDQGANEAIERMKAYVEDKFDDRYSGVIGKGRWVKDKILPLPDFVKDWFTEAHTQFEADLDKLVVQVANLVEQQLARAKLLISQGENEIRIYVSGLKPSLQAVGKSAEKDLQDRFGDLRRAVDDRKQAMAQKLAQQYKDARDKGDAALKELRDKHKSLYERVRDFVEEVVEVLRNFKRRILSLLKKAAEVIGLIVRHPIRFLENLIGAIKQGLAQFKDHIWDHLQEALFQWMFGSLAEAGITVPKDFSLGGILKLLLAVLGLTYERIRGKMVRLIGERNVALIEKVWSVVHTLLTGGPAALWEQIKEYISTLPDLLISTIKNWVITEIIKAAITKLAMLFNPVGAIVQAIITIYNTVMFFIERYKQIFDFVEGVFNSIAEIAKGNIGAAANAIEKSLVRMLTVLISFLARFAGITGITSKIKDFIEQIRERVDKAIDFLIEKIAKTVRGLVNKFVGRPEAKSTGPAPVGYEAIRARTRELLLSRIHGEHSRAEIAGVVSQTFGDVRAWGVRALQIGPEQEDGSSDIFIEVNPRGTAARLYARTQRTTMRVITKIMVEPGFDVAKAPMVGLTAPSVVPGTPEEAGSVRYARFKASSAGAAVMPMAPMAGQPYLRVESWNVNEASMFDSTSHAERQMSEWLVEQPWLANITSIRVENYHFNPCQVCAQNLVHTLSKVNAARAEAGKPKVSAELTWNPDRPWKNELRSQGIPGTAEMAARRITETIALMNGRGWHVEPAGVSPTGRQGLEKAFEVR